MDANQDRKVQAAFDGHVSAEQESDTITRMRKQIDAYGIALMGIAVGCSGHRELAHKTLAEWNPRAAADVDAQNQKEKEARKAEVINRIMEAKH